MLKRQSRRMFIQLCIHSLPLTLVLCVAAVCRVRLACSAGHDVLSAAQTHRRAGAIPPLGVLAWVGGVAWCRARAGLLYIS